MPPTTTDRPVTPGLDIVIPVYNEGANIRRVLEALREAVRTPFRVLICYDFEEDSSVAVLRDSPVPDVNVEFVRNPGRGPHAAVIAGFRASKADAITVFPGDDDYNAPRLDAMAEKIAQGNDIVCASRFMRGGSMTGCPWLKAMLVRTAAFTLFHFARLPTHDATNGFRTFSRRIVEEIEIESTSGFTYSLEVLVKVHRLGWPVAEVPVQWFERAPGQGSSRFRVLRWVPAYLRWYLYGIATTYLRRRPKTVRRTPLA